MNGTTHGLASHGVLLPSERAQDYEDNLQGWFLTLAPQSPGEGRLVATAADVAWRMGRLSRLEERMVSAALEKSLADSAPAKALQTAEEALQAVRSVAVLAEGTKVPRAAESVAQIASPLRFVVDLLGKTGIALEVESAFEQAVARILADSYADVEPTAFEILASAARDSEAALLETVSDLIRALEAEREKLADCVLLGNDDAQLLDRHRARLNREFEATLSNIKLLRELAVSAQDAEDQKPIPVELRVVGASARMDRAGLLEQAEERTR